MVLNPNLNALEKAKFIENSVDIGTDVRVSVKASQNFLLEIAKGNVPGHSVVHKFGRNTNVDVANIEDVTSIGGRYTFLSTGTTIDVSSDNVNDTSAGSGLRTAQIQGLEDVTWNEINETIITNGSSIVTTINSFIRINRIIGLTAGASEENEGLLSFKSGVSTIGELIPGNNQTQMAVYSVPNGKTAYLTRIYGSLLPSARAVGFKEGELSIFIREFGGLFRVAKDIGLSTRSMNTFPFDFEVPVRCPAKTDIRMSFESHQNNSKVSGGFEMILVDD